MKTINVPNLEALPAAAKEFVGLMGDNTVFAFYGDMGAGKTTFINELCRALGVDGDDTASPTFALINEYRSETTAELIYHFDFYRIDDSSEVEVLGLNEFFYDDRGVSVIEWGENIADLIPANSIRVTIEKLSENRRRITLKW